MSDTLEDKVITRFKTKSINQAAWLWCFDEVTLIELQKDEERSPVILFLFEVEMTQAVLSSHILNYANQKCRVEPISFVQNQNKLRDLLYLKKKNERESDVRSKTSSVV